jgi:hypothetical protein
MRDQYRGSGSDGLRKYRTGVKAIRLMTQLERDSDLFKNLVEVIKIFAVEVLGHVRRVKSLYIYKIQSSLQSTKLNTPHHPATPICARSIPTA